MLYFCGLKSQNLMKMKKSYIIFAAMALALCSCGGKDNSQNQPENVVVNDNTEDQKVVETLLFKPQATAQEAFPNNCDTVCFQQGDLNNDGIQDLVICATPRNPENMMTRDDGYEYNFNEPVLAVYFGQDGEKYSLFKEYPNTIPGSEDEFTFVTVEPEITEKCVLKFDVEVFYSAGSSQTGQNSYLYRFQDDDFYLIGSDTRSFSRYSGEEEAVSCNYLTKKQKTTTSNVFDDKVKPTETWTDLPDEPLERLGARVLY